MKSFVMIKEGRITSIVELSFADMLKLLLGRELQLDNQHNQASLTLRQRQAYEMFNLAAPKVVKCE